VIGSESRYYGLCLLPCQSVEDPGSRLLESALIQPDVIQRTARSGPKDLTTLESTTGAKRSFFGPLQFLVKPPKRPNSRHPIDPAQTIFSRSFPVHPAKLIK
jgi:hypothetical protein